MSGRGLVVLAIAAVVALVGTFYVVERRAPEGTVEHPLLFPEFADQLNTVGEIAIRTYDGNISLRRNRRGDWVIADRGDYLANFDSVRRLLIAVSETRILEYKTANPALYPKLGIQGIESETSPSIELSINDKSAQSLARFIIGNLKTAGVASGVVTATKGYYAKLPDEPRGILVRGELEVSRQVRDWLDGLILNIANARIQDILVQHPDMQVHIHRPNPEDPDFVLDDIPEGQALKSRTQLNRMGDILTDFRIDDVVMATEHEFGDAVVRTRVETIDGLVIESTSEYVDGVAHAAFSADVLGSAEPAQQQEAAQLNEKLGAWVYQIPFFKYDTLARKIGPLVQPVTPQDATTDQEASAAAQDALPPAAGQESAAPITEGAE